MTSDFHDRAAERDETLIKGLCQAARTSLLELREWAQTELKASLAQAEFLERTVEGVIGDEIRSSAERLRAINQRDLQEAVTTYDDVMATVSSGGYVDVYDAYNQLQQGSHGLVLIVRELLKIRDFIGAM